MYRVVAVGVVHHPAVSQQLRSLGRTFGVLHRLDDSHQRNIAARGTAAEPHTRQQHARHSSNRICLIIQSHKALNAGGKKGRVAHTRLPSVGCRSWSQCLALSLQVTWIINPTVGCHYFPPGLQLPLPLRGLLPILLHGEQRHNGCKKFV